MEGSSTDKESNVVGFLQRYTRRLPRPGNGGTGWPRYLKGAYMAYT